MSVQIETSLYQDQKKSKPAIEAMIAEQLEGQAQKIALDFVAYLRENKMAPLWASANSWKVSYKGKGVCYIKLDQQGKSAWKINPMTDYSKDYEAFVAKENLRETIWQNVAHCTRCHPNSCAPKGCADTFSGVKKTYFGKEMDNICRGGDTSFVNPGEEAIHCLKKMIEYKRRAIEANAVPKVKYMSQKRRISKTEIVVIDKEIKVVGLSLEKTGWPKRGDKLGDLWGVYSDAHRKRTNAKTPIVEYGLWFSKGDDFDYIVGSEVVEFGETGDEQISLSIPAGKYIKDTFNAFDFEQLVMEALQKREAIVTKWAKENNVTIANPTMVVEVYPVQEMVGLEGEVTNESFKRDDRISAKYPFMYTLILVDQGGRAHDGKEKAIDRGNGKTAER